jgi:hypothetical protein
VNRAEQVVLESSFFVRHVSNSEFPHAYILYTCEKEMVALGEDNITSLLLADLMKL